MLGHVGESRLFDTIAAHMIPPTLRRRVEEYVSTCQVCKMMKLLGKGYGHLPPREARLQPFEEIACDSIGQLSFQHSQPYVPCLIYVKLSENNMTHHWRLGDYSNNHGCTNIHDR